MGVHQKIAGFSFATNADNPPAYLRFHIDFIAMPIIDLRPALGIFQILET